MSTIPNGYKQTEVGVIPSDWEVKSLGNITKLKNGYAFSSRYFSHSGHIIITPGNFKLSGGLIFTNKNTLRFSGEVNQDMQFKNGDLLIVMTDLTQDCNLLGKPGIVNSEEVILHNQRIGKITITSDSVNKGFLYWFFVSELFSKRMKETATGSTVRHTSVRSINSSLLALPTITEQTAIATALSDADALITQLENLIDKKRNIKQGAMQELLRPKEGWEEKKLGEIIHLQGGYAFKSELFTSIGIPIIRISDVGNNKVDTDNSVCYEPFNIPKEFVAKKGDVLIAMSGATTGKIGVYSNDSIAYINQRVGKFVVLNLQDTSQEFVSHIVSSERFKENLSKEIAQGAQPNISGKQIQSIILPIPKFKSEQTRIAQILTDMDAEIEQLEKKLDKYKMMKQGMMQNLLTGKIRLV